MSRDERPSGSDLTSGLGPTRPRTSSGFDASNGIESIRLGCSMLAKLRFRPRNPAHFATMRCSLGYALHGSEDVAKCLAVEGPNECWKMVPNWRVATQETNVDSAAVHDAPHIVELEESSGYAEADPVSGEEIAVAEEALQQSVERMVPINPAAPAMNGAADVISMEAEAETVESRIVHAPTGTVSGTSD